MNVEQRFTDWARRVVLVLGALAIVGALLHVPPLERAVSHLVSGMLEGQIDGLAVGRIEYRLWALELSAHEIELDRTAGGVSLSLSLPEIRARWEPFSGLAVVARRPVVEARRLGSPPREATPATARSPAPALALPGWLDAARIEEGRVSWRDEAGNEVSLGAVRLELRSGLAGISGRLDVESGRAELGGETLVLRDAGVDVRGSDETIHVERARVVLEGASLAAEGVVELDPTEVSGEADFDAEGALIGGALSAPTLRGELTGDATLELAAGSWSGRGRLEAEGLSWRWLRPWDVDVGWRLEGETLSLSTLALDAADHEGSIRGEARLGLGRGGRQEASLRVRALPLHELGWRSLAGEALPWAATARGAVDLSLSDWRAETLSGEARLDFGGEVRGWTRATADAGEIEADVEITAGDVSLLAGALLPGDTWSVSGPLELSASVRGDLGSSGDPTARARMESDGLVVSDEAFELRGRLQYRESELSVEEIVLTNVSSGGAASVAGDVGLSGPTSLVARLEALPIAFAARELGLRSGTATGRVRLEGELADPALDATLELNELDVRGVEGSARLEAVKRGGSVTIERLALSFREGSLEARGTVHLDEERLVLDARGGGMALHHLVPPDLWPRQLEAGLARLEASLEGPWRRPAGRVRLEMDPMAYEGRSLPPLWLALETDGAEATAELGLEPGTAALTASTELRADLDSRAELVLGAVPWEPLARAFDVTSVDRLAVEGDLEARLPLRRPESFELDARVARLEAEASTVSLRAARPFRLGATAEAIDVEGLALRVEGGEVFVDGRMALAPEGAAALTVDADLDLSSVAPLVPGDDLEGRLAGELTLRGRLSAPRLFGSLSIEDGRWSSGPLVVEALRASASARGSVLDVQRIEARMLGGDLTADGELALPGGSGGEGGASRLSFRAASIGLAPFLADDDAGIDFPVSVDGAVRFGAGGLEALEASGEVTSIALRTPAAEIASASPATWRLASGRLFLDRLDLAGEGTSLRARAEASLWGEGGSSFRASAEGDLNLAVVNAFVPEDVFVDGASSLDVSVTSEDGRLRADGTSRVAGGEIVLEEPPLAVTEIEAAFALEDGALVIESLHGSANGGDLKAEGRFPLFGRSPGESSEVRLSAEGLRLEYPEGFRSRVDAELELSDGEGYELSGRVTVEQARYVREISVERELLAAIRRQTIDLAREPGFADRLRLDLDVDSVNDVVVDNNLGQLRAEVNVLVTGTAAAPELSGTVRARPGGELTFAGNRYQVETARVDLFGYPVTPPEVDVRARTEAGGRDLVLELTGSLENLRTSLSSPGDPSLSRADVASLLVTGRTLGEVRGEEAEVVGEQVAQYLGGGLADLTESELGDALPVSSLSLQPTLVGRETDPGARLSLGQAIADDLFLTYSIALDNPESQLWIVDYDLPHRLRLRGVREDGNEYTGTLSQELLFDVYERSRPTPIAGPASPPLVDVRVGGSLPVSMEALPEDLGLDLGDAFDYWQAREDAQTIQRSLQEKGYLSAEVFVRTERASDPDTAGAEGLVLTFDVEPGLPVRLSWTGDAIDESLRDLALRDWEPHLPPRSAAIRRADAVTWELRSRGFYAADVVPAVREGSSEVEVAFDVERGPEGKRVVVDVEGNEVVTDGEVRALLPDRDSVAFFERLAEDDERLRESIRLLYATRGYADASASLDARFDEPSGEYRVEIEIEEGEPALLGDVVLSGNEAVSDDQLRKELSLETGDLLRLGTYMNDRRRLASYYRREGFTDARIRSRIERAGEGLDVVFEIEEGERVRVGEIEIEGAVVTDESLIRRRVVTSPGAPLRLGDLTRTQSRLYDLHAFRSVDVRAESSGTPGVRDVVIRVSERPDVSLSYGFRYSTEDRWEVTGNVDLPNLFGEARRLNLSVFVNDNDRVFRGTLHLPYFFGLDLDSDVFVSREIETDEDLESRGWSLTFQQGKPVGDALRAQWSYTYRRAAVTAPGSLDDPFGFDVVAGRGIVTGSLIHDSRDSLTAPRRGWLWNGTLQLAASALGSDVGFARLYSQLFHFRPVLGRGVVWASSYRAGVARPFGDQVLLPQDRFQAGGPNSVRGFPVDGLGPSDPFLGVEMGGQGVVVVNQELRVPVWGRFGAVAFYDAGNVFLEASDFDPLDLRHSVGVGLRVSLPVGLVRVDWARVLNPEAGMDRSRFHFSFGHAF